MPVYARRARTYPRADASWYRNVRRTPAKETLSPLATIVLRVGVPLAVLAIVLAFFLGEQTSIDHELSLIAPPVVAPGHTIPLRAHLFDRLHAPEGPRLASAKVRVRLVDAAGIVRAMSELAPSIAGGADGAIAIPRELRGRHTLEAVAHVEGEPVASARKPIELRSVAPPAPLVARTAGALQQLSELPVEMLAGDPPVPFSVCVASAACVPEARCELLVHVGEPPAAVRIVPAPSVSLGEPSTSAETSGIVLLPITVHGPEANIEIVASRSNVDVARRSIRVPIALATPALRAERRLLRPSETLRITVDVLGDHPGIIVDAYRDGLWRATQSFAASDAPLEPALDRTPGLWRLQVRTDPFSSDRAAVVHVLVRSENEDAASALSRAFETELPEGPDELRLAWASAALEESVHPLPPALSGRAEDEARLRARQGTLRWFLVAALVLGVLVGAIVLVRRGLDAAHEAQRVMEATGDAELGGVRNRRRILLSAMAIVATAILAFVAAAALIVARAHLLE